MKSEGHLSSNFLLSLGERWGDATSDGGRKHEQDYAPKLQGQHGKSGASWVSAALGFLPLSLGELVGLGEESQMSLILI